MDGWTHKQAGKSDLGIYVSMNTREQLKSAIHSIRKIQHLIFTGVFLENALDSFYFHSVWCCTAGGQMLNLFAFWICFCEYLRAKSHLSCGHFFGGCWRSCWAIPSEDTSSYWQQNRIWSRLTVLSSGNIIKLDTGSQIGSATWGSDGSTLGRIDISEGLANKILWGPAWACQENTKIRNAKDWQPSVSATLSFVEEIGSLQITMTDLLV